MSTSGVRVVPIIAKPQQYAWGKLGKDSEVAKVLSAGGQPVDDSKPYAELWMGTHPTAPSSVLPSPPSSPSPSSPIPLSTYLTHDLPYLFKILSIRSALSIQAHPDIPLAQRLHSSNPKEYRDANHKPEMATSITPFEALCGFRPHAQIVGYLGLVKELREVVGEAVAAAYERAVQGGEEGEMKRQLRAVFTALMTAKEATFVPALHHLLAHLPSTDPYACPPPSSTSPPPSKPTSLNVFQLLPRLQSQYPSDIGIFCPFLLNTFSSPPFHSLFLPANEPHAYLSGDIIECMACSDNVVRAGLTPKFRDVEVLCGMLTYEAREVEYVRGEGARVGEGEEGVEVLRPPIEEFELSVVRVTGEGEGGVGGKVAVAPGGSHGILLVWKGEGRMVDSEGGEREVKAGDVWLVPEGVGLELTGKKGGGGGGEDLIAFKCAENDRMKKGKTEGGGKAIL